VTIFVLQDLNTEIDHIKTKNLSVVRLNSKNLFDFSSFLRLKRMLKAYDSIFAHLIWAQYWTGIFCFIDKTFRNRVIWFEHNVYKNRKNIHWLLLSFLGRFVKKVLVVSEEVAEYFLGKTKLKSIIVHNAIYIPSHLQIKPEFNKKHFDIAIFGRLIPQKNPFLAIESFLKLSKQNDLSRIPRLNLIGDGTLKEQITEEFAPKSNIKVYGHLERSLALRKLARYQIFLSTSNYEGFPLARFEALKLGLCVVSTRTAGYKFLLDYYKSDSAMQDVGIFFVDDDSSEICLALRALMNPKFWLPKAVKARVSCTDLLLPRVVAAQLLKELND
jgi:glycosyltransferase involved in cell wall biosynthesis